MTHLPSQVYFISPFADVECLAEFSSTTQIKLMLITSTNYTKACEQKLLSGFPRVQKNVNSLQMKYLNLLKVRIESAPSNSILGIPKRKLKQEKAFRFESSNWYWTVRNETLLSLHYWLTGESCRVICNCFQVSWFKSLVQSLQIQ